MNKLLIYIILSFFVLSCNDIDKPKKPDNLISENKMTDIITDINLAIAAKGVDKKLLEEKGVNPEEYIFQKYNIDSLQFAENSNYYAYDVKKYENIYSQVKQRLEKQKEEYEAIEKREKKEKDSIRASKRKKSDSKKTTKIQKDSVRTSGVQKKLLKEAKPANLLKKSRRPQ